MRQVGHVPHVLKMRNANNVLVGKSEQKQLPGRISYRRKKNIKMDLMEIGCKGLDYIQLAQDRLQW